MFTTTGGEDRGDFQAYYGAFFHPLRSILRLAFRVGHEDVDDLGRRFFARVLEDDLLARCPDRRGPFRRWLFAALKDHLADREARPIPGATDLPDDPDSLFALFVLNATLETMRHHCERSGRPEVCAIFERWFVGGGDDVEALFPANDPQFLANRLATAKRIFRRILPDVIPPPLTERVVAEERFADWWDIYRTSRAGRQNRAHLDGIAEPLTDDELQVLLSVRLSIPLESYLGRLDVAAPPPKKVASKNLDAFPEPAPPPCLLTLLTPASEAGAGGGIDRLALFKRIKSGAKRVHANGGNVMSPGIGEVVYNLAIVLALIQCRARITDLEDAALLKNVRWALSRPWLDDRLRPIFERGLREIDEANTGAP